MQYILNKIALKTNTRIFIFILILWASIQTLLVIHFGIKTNGESVKYIAEAHHIINEGGLSSSQFLLYITQISLILLALKLKLGFGFIVAVQMFFNLLATLSIYRFTKFLFTPIIGLFATVWFLLNLPIQQFNTFLQTDSLFYSFTIIYTCYLLQIERLSLKVLAIVMAALLLISVTRPTGLFFFAATFLYFYFRFFNLFRWSVKILFLVFISFIFLYFLNTAIGSGGALDFMLPARYEMIICGVPSIPNAVRINEIDDGNSLRGLFYYITHNFSQFSRLAYERSIAFFGILRSYYSMSHKIYLIIIFFPIYIMMLLSIKYWIKKNPLVLLYFVCLILFTWVTVILSCDDWHNRFYLTISPYLMILSLPAIHSVFLKKVPD